MNASLFSAEQVECRQGGEHNEDCNHYGGGHNPLPVGYLHDGVVSRVDQQVPNEDKQYV